MNIDLIQVPLFYGCDREGVEYGPQTDRVPPQQIATLS